MENVGLLGLFFHRPMWLWALPVVWGVFFVFRGKVASPTEPDSAQLRFPDSQRLTHFEDKPRIKALWVFYALVFSLMFVAIAKPYTLAAPEQNKTLHKQFLLVVDVSPSMALADYTDESGNLISRMDTLKDALGGMLKRRTDDQYGLIAFGDEAAILVPMSEDANLIFQQMMRLQPGLLGQGTAIGDALAMATKGLSQSSSEKVVILFSDGRNTAGLLTPAEGLAFARDNGLRIYTVMISPDPDSEITDKDPSLEEIAELTRGAYFAAKEQSALAKAIASIESMEVGEIQTQTYFQSIDRTLWLLYGVVALLFMLWLWQWASLLWSSIVRWRAKS